MKPARGSTIWAGLTIVIGFLLVHFFLRKSNPPTSFSKSEPNRTEAGHVTAFPSDLTGVEPIDRQSAAISMASQRKRQQQLPLDELTFGTGNIALPDWAPPPSRLDGLIAEGGQQAASGSLPLELQEIPTWLPEEPKPPGSSGPVNSSTQAGFNSGSASAWQGDRRDSSFDSVDSPRDALPWPDEQLATSQPMIGYERSTIATAETSAVSHRGALDERRPGANPLVGSELGPTSIRAGPSVLGQQHSGNHEVGFGQQVSQAQARINSTTSTQVQQQITPSEWRDHVADRKKRFVYQPGYRPDD